MSCCPAANVAGVSVAGGRLSVTAAARTALFLLGLIVESHIFISSSTVTPCGVLTAMRLMLCDSAVLAAVLLRLYGISLLMLQGRRYTRLHPRSWSNTERPTRALIPTIIVLRRWLLWLSPVVVQ